MEINSISLLFKLLTEILLIRIYEREQTSLVAICLLLSQFSFCPRSCLKCLKTQ